VAPSPSSNRRRRRRGRNSSPDAATIEKVETQLVAAARRCIWTMIRRGVEFRRSASVRHHRHSSSNRRALCSSRPSRGLQPTAITKRPHTPPPSHSQNPCSSHSRSKDHHVAKTMCCSERSLMPPFSNAQECDVLFCCNARVSSVSGSFSTL
jgi:hypothetical protein